jgi:hypothetical protein
MQVPRMSRWVVSFSNTPCLDACCFSFANIDFCDLFLSVAIQVGTYSE